MEAIRSSLQVSLMCRLNLLHAIHGHSREYARLTGRLLPLNHQALISKPDILASRFKMPNGLPSEKRMNSSIFGESLPE